jgi:glycosyltransferase involved in cell wall biosynthesis
MACRACRNAERIIAVSGYVRDFLCQDWGISSEKIGMVYHGVDSLAEPKQPAGLANWDRPFLFTAGSIRPARGLEDLLRALPSVPDLPAEYGLVIAGQADPRMESYHRHLETLVRKHGLEHRVHWAGRLTPAEMAWCYRHCRWFVMTSRAEACPNTALEALADGCAIVSTDQPPMPEFFQTSALYYTARDSASLAHQLHKALHLPETERSALQAAARARGAEFQWSRTARQTVDELQRALQPAPLR